MQCSNEREWTIWQMVVVKKQIDVSFSCVCPVIDNEYHHNIVKSSLQIHLAITLWIHSYFNNVMMKFVISNRRDAWKSDINLLNGRAVSRASMARYLIQELSLSVTSSILYSFPGQFSLCCPTKQYLIFKFWLRTRSHVESTRLVAQGFCYRAVIGQINWL